MFKMALFDCAINEKCCSVDGGRGICPPFSSPPRVIWQLKSPHPQEFAIQGKKMLMPGGQPGGGGGVGAAGIDWCIKDPASTQHFSHQFSQALHLTVLEPVTGHSQIHWPATSFWSSLNDFEYNY